MVYQKLLQCDFSKVTVLYRFYPDTRETGRGMLCLHILLLYVLGTSTANWMYLGLSSLATHTHITSGCTHIPGMVRTQIRLCETQPQTVPCIQTGARLAIFECRWQFKYERWNCSISSRNYSVFGPVMDKGTRETGFIHAVSSAAVVYSITKSCGAGNITDCMCKDMSKKRVPDQKTSQISPTATEVWKWGGCSDNVEYGVRFSREFVDATETSHHESKSKDARSLVNLHNNEVGRKVIMMSTNIACRCHGVSGSCTVKTCWRKMPTFRAVGDELKARYVRSVQVAPRARRRLRRKDRVKRKVRIPSDQMVHIEESPNYCERDPSTGIPGTRGRICQRLGKGAENCDLLCCGRGYNIEQYMYHDRCDCKFIWCCDVKCQVCTTIEHRFTCK